jgi:predicted lactoylglutathione lyase
MTAVPNVPTRMNFLTLACRDVERMAEFFRSLGWPEAPSSDADHRVFQLENGVVLALYGAHHYEPAYGLLTERFHGFTLGINVGSRDEVVAVHAALAQIAGIGELEPVVDSPHGFSGFSFQDPEGNIWDVAWKAGSAVGDGGELTWN